jgi:tetratricopeptide (TPR) repeat protein
MKRSNYSIMVVLSLILLSCAAVQTAGVMQSGRQALFRGDYNAAVAYFREVAERDPNFVYGTALRQGIWSYVGRAEYLTGQLPQARQSLERALAANETEDIARLYLGLTLARSGDYSRGLKEIENAMKGIDAWLEYINEAYRYSFGQYWDPGRSIRNAIEKNLAMISQESIDREKFIAAAEQLGEQMEEEIDRAQKQETEEQSRDSEGRGRP